MKSHFLGIPIKKMVSFACLSLEKKYKHPKASNAGKKGLIRVVLRSVIATICLFALWLLLSGVYKPLVISLGAASSILAIFFLRRMDALDGRPAQIDVRPLAFLGYFFWLLKEIAKSNWAVTKAVLSPKINLRQHFFAVPFTQKTDVAEMLFANSITLTPGTITVETEADHFLVHALLYNKDVPADLADMDARVSATEGRV